MQQSIELYEPAPDTASDEALIAALTQALKDAPGVVVAVAPDVQLQSTAKAA